MADTLTQPPVSNAAIIDLLQEGIRIVKFTNMNNYGTFINQDAQFFVDKAQGMIKQLEK